MKCQYPNCGRDEDILFYCNNCKGSFCNAHRAPSAHHCTRQYVTPSTQTPPHQQSSAGANDLFRAVMHQMIQGGETAGQRQQSPYQRLTDVQRRKIIESRLKASPELFSLGNEPLDLMFGFSLIVLVFGFFQFMRNQSMEGFIIAAILVGTAFLPHELAHKYVAIKKGQFARYILWVRGLMFTFLTLIIGIVLIVPGFVAIVPIKEKLNKKDLGLVAFAGPISNVIIGSLALSFVVILQIGFFSISGFFGNMDLYLKIGLFNGLVGAFNCIPVWQLDGKKILNWSKPIYFVLIAGLALIILVSSIM